jgi:hypothetical protein
MGGSLTGIFKNQKGRINLAEDRVQWRALQKSLINVQVLCIATGGFSRAFPP